MAKDTTNTGFLNFGMDGDNKELLKNLEQAKNEAKSIENIYKNINLNAGGKTIAANTQKSQIAADKLIISQNKVTQSAMNALKAEQQLETAIINETNAKARGVVIERQRMLALQKSLLYAKQGEALSAESARKEALYKQKLLVEEERLAGVRKRNAMIYLQEEKELASASAQTNKTMFNPQNLLQQLSSATGFIKELMTVSGEFEKQRISLTAIIGDDQAGNRIFSQIKELAVTSPFDFKELTDSAKQLSAFSVPANEIFETTNRLADLSAGLGVDMSRIVNAYGQVQSASVLRIQELQQFTEAGIPLVDELAKKFTNLSGEVVSAGDVIDKISNGEVSFGMIKEIITELTSEGGKFYNMQEVQSETLAGKISSLRNNYDMLLDSLGKANKGLLNGAVDGLIELMANWEKYWRILKSVIVTYGIYRAGLAINASIQKFEGSNILQNTLAMKAKEAEHLKQISLSRDLTKQENIRLATADKLTTADFKTLASNGQINKSMALKMIASKQMTEAQAGHLKTILGLTNQEIKLAANMTKFGRAALYAKTMMSGLMTSLKALAMNPYTWILTAIGGIVYAYQTWSDYNSKLEESTQEMTNAVLEEYTKIRDFFQKESIQIKIALETGSEEEIQRELNKLKDKLKEYGTFGLNIISQAEGGKDKDGNEVKGIENSTEKLRFYESSLLDIEKAYQKVNQYPAMFIDANDELGGIIRDNLSDELEDLDKAALKYDKALSKLNKISPIYRDFASELIVSGKATGVFADSLQVIVDKGGTAAEVLKTIKQHAKYEEVYSYRPKWYEQYRTEIVDWNLATINLKSAQENYEEKLKAFVADIKSRNEFKDVDWTKPIDRTTEMTIRIYSENFISKFDKISEKVKQEFLTKTIPLVFNFQPELNLSPLKVQSELQQTVDLIFNNLNNNFGVTPEKIRPNSDVKSISGYVKEQQSIIESETKRIAYTNNALKYKSLTPKMKEYWEKQKEEAEASKKVRLAILKELGQPLNKQENKPPKDGISEEIKSQLELIKEAKKQYEDYRRVMSKEDADKALSINNKDKNIDLKNLTDEGYLDFIREQLKKIEKNNSDTAKNIRTTWNKEIGAIQIEQLTQAAKRNIEKLEKSLSEYKEKYNLYRQVSNITGDDKYAARVVFGEADASVKPNIEIQKEAFKEQSGISFSDFINLDDENKAKLLINDELKKLYNSIEQTEKEEQNRKKDIYLSSLKDYQDIQEKRLALTKEYQEKIAIARSYNDEKLAGKLETALSGDLLKLTPDYEKFFSAIYSMTKDKANDIGALIKKNLKDQLDQGVISAKEYYENIEKVNNELEKSEKGVNLFDRLQSGGVEGLLNGIKEIAKSRKETATIDFEKAKSDWSKSFYEWREAMKSGDKSAADIAQNNMMSATNRQSIAKDSVNKSESMLNWVSKIQAAFAKTGKIVDYIDQSVRGAQRIVDTFADLAEQRGIDTSKGAWGEIKNVMSVISQVNEKVKGIFESGKSGDIGGMVAGTVELIAIGFKSVNGEHKKALKLLEAQRKQLEHTYAISKARKSLEYEQGNTVFGNDSWGKATNAANVYSEQQKVMEESLQKLNDASVVTGSKKSGWGAFRKRKDVWQNLLKAYPELIDSAGKFNKELAESILNNRKLDEEGKTNLQHAIENAQLLEDAYAKMKDYLSNIFGKLGEDMTDAFVDSFKNGTDAVEAFYKSASGMLERLAKDMIYSVTLAPIIEEAQKKMEGVMKNTSLNDEERFYKYTDIIGGLINNALDKQNDVNALIERVKDRAKKENNIEIFGPDKSNQDTLSKGIESVTEETANLVASYLNAMRAEQAAQGLNLIELVRLNQLNTDQFANMYAELIRIQVNTLTTANNTSRLVELGENTNTILRQATISGSGTKFNI